MDYMGQYTGETLFLSLLSSPNNVVDGCWPEGVGFSLKVLCPPYTSRVDLRKT